MPMIRKADLSYHGAVVEVVRPGTAVVESDKYPPQRPVETHRRHGDRKLGAVGQDAHARHELNDSLAGPGVPDGND